MNEQQAKELLTRYRNGECTEQEQLLVNLWIEQEVERGSWNISDEEKALFGVQLKNTIDEARDHVAKKSTVKLWPRIVGSRVAAAAAVLLVAGLSIFFYSRYVNTLRHPDADQGLGLAGHDIKPGSNKAYLTLANGKRLSLTDAANGELAKEAGVEITKTADGQVVYKTASDISGRHPEFSSGSRTSYSNALNTIETPRGGQYQVRLPDGSKVWLNAASKLIYPVSFNGRGQRVVELYGEAYFEIFKNKLQPFVVKSKNQEVTVLGTHFNVNSYTDEGSVKTTLLEGSVQVSILQPLSASGGEMPAGQRGDNGSTGNSNSSLPARGISPRGGERLGVMLKPGEQALLTNSKINVVLADLDETMAWQKGDFVFKDEPLESIMKKIARWYDVEVVYAEGAPRNITLGGLISRSKNLSAVLKMMERTKVVKFKVEGKKVIVLPVKK